MPIQTGWTWEDEYGTFSVRIDGDSVILDSAVTEHGVRQMGFVSGVMRMTVEDLSGQIPVWVLDEVRAAMRAVPPPDLGSASLEVWRTVAPTEAEAIRATIQRLADAEGEAVKWRDVDTLDPAPTVEILGARREGKLLSVQFRYEFGIFRYAQSGSDWTEVHTHVGEASCRDGVVLSHTLERTERSIVDRSES
jgi:hypothetical protein